MNNSTRDTSILAYLNTTIHLNTYINMHTTVYISLGDFQFYVNNYCVPNIHNMPSNCSIIMYKYSLYVQ